MTREFSFWERAVLAADKALKGMERDNEDVRVILMEALPFLVRAVVEETMEGKVHPKGRPALVGVGSLDAAATRLVDRFYHAEMT